MTNMGGTEKQRGRRREEEGVAGEEAAEGQFARFTRYQRMSRERPCDVPIDIDQALALLIVLRVFDEKKVFFLRSLWKTISPKRPPHLRV